MTHSYTLDLHGIYRPCPPVEHRDDEYDTTGFDTLWRMQEQHFWYRGRHRFLLKALDRFKPQSQEVRAVDLGGGVGGWVRYLEDRRSNYFRRLALADSSELALTMAADILPASVDRYQIDLMNLGWKKEWDIAFMFDVLEHIPDDVRAISQAAEALKPGGYLFVTTPALRQFWSYNDEVASHLRRYSHQDYAHLAQAAGLDLCDTRYFMFFLSPLYWLTRRRKKVDHMSEGEKAALSEQAHQVPFGPANALLYLIFAFETSLGHKLRFPWGTSILGVFQKP
jgi:SAM-dependent methyltransferase